MDERIKQHAVIRALKSTELDVRMSCGDRWLVWDRDQYTVYSRKRHQKNTRVILDTDDIEAAIWSLMTGTVK